MIASPSARLLLIRLTRSKKSEGAKVTWRFTISLAKTTWLHSEDGIASQNWKSWFVLLSLIAPRVEPIILMPLCIAGSTFLPQRSERELPPVSRFAISYQEQSKKSFGAKTFTGSK